MSDKKFMYGTDHDPLPSETIKGQNLTETTSMGKILIESGGKKIEVVTAKEYDQMAVRVSDAEKQIRMLKTELQNMKKFVNKIAKAAEKPFERFN